MKIAALAGGVGGSKLLLGLYRVMDPAHLTIIVNTGDDIVMHGLHVSPDPDIITYTLAGLVNEETGWGIAGETFRVAEGLARYGRPVWFKLGDRDLATHINRSALLREGATLSQAMDSIRTTLGVRARLLPMSDDSVPTMLETDEGRMHLQDYLVRRRCEPKLKAIAFEGVERARPAPGVIEAIEDADGIVVSPSNPLISIGPILAVAGVREALRKRRADVGVVCPLVGGKSLKGPSDKMMAELGYEVSAVGAAKLYRDVCGTFVIDELDEAAAAAIEALGMRAVVQPTVMTSTEDKERLARHVLALFAP
jgi:LPPG:FO 2-phospho-L-lactate transferase